MFGQKDSICMTSKDGHRADTRTIGARAPDVTQGLPSCHGSRLTDCRLIRPYAEWRIMPSTAGYLGRRLWWDVGAAAAPI